MEREPIAPLHHRPLRRRGFTMLEILVVIGIIILLVGIGVIGYRVLDPSDKATKATLSTLQSMLSEYEGRTALREQPQQIYVNDALTNTAPKANPPVNDLWWTPVVMDTSAAAGAYSVTSGSAKRYDWGPVGNTQLVMRLLTRMPENKTLLTKILSRQVHGVADGGKSKLLPLNDPKTIDPPLVLDAWSNPILFVGRAGLDGVTFESKKDSADPKAAAPSYHITSVGKVAGAIDLNKVPKNARPFFVSAGPDGDFRTGDDNLYSFNP